MSERTAYAAFVQAVQAEQGRPATRTDGPDPDPDPDPDANDGTGRGAAEATCAALYRLADELVGARLFTLMRFDASTGEACRAWSSDTVHYPVSGTKPLPRNHWTGHVIEQQRIFVANDLDGIAGVFADHALIAALGCQSVVNVPIVLAGEVIGTVNCLHVAGHYTPERVQAAEALVLPGLVALLSFWQRE